MISESELRTQVQDIIIDLTRTAPDTAEVPYTWTGKYVEFASVPSRFPWNGDLYGRSWADTDSVVAFYLDHSVPGIGYGQWYYRDQRVGIVAAADLPSLLAELGLD